MTTESNHQQKPSRPKNGRRWGWLAPLIGGIAIGGACAGFARVTAEPVMISDVEQRTRELLQEHSTGCGSLSWYPSDGPDGIPVSEMPSFLAARVPTGETLVSYADVDVDQPIFYVTDDGSIAGVAPRFPHGVAYLPLANQRPSDIQVWQSESSGDGTADAA